MEKTLITNTIVLDSNQESINKVTSYIDAIYSSSENDISDTYGNVIIAITEAVNNAINHGNKEDPSKKVTVSYKKSNENISFTIEDEGEGFDFENVPDPTDPENLHKLNGRGIFLMKNLVDDIHFHENGKKIELIFKTA
ncbi:ATP-binding protein [Flavobacteriales bacterium]|nr:ATP-binding protein [Flavobacteriales bacterium]MDA9262312.1 ATP-binding protein [bacterium]MDB4089001.1 ATP-binding protein [Flavobacteriales bacterium]